MQSNRLKKYGIRILKIIGWTVLSVTLLLIAISIAIQIPAVQNRITQRAISFLKEKIGTEVRLEHISLKFPKKIVLTGLYLEDQRRDTLLYAGKLGVDTDLFALLKNKIDLKNIELENFTAKISRSEVDSAYNFDYILDAFATDTAAVEQDTTAGWEFALGKITLKKINVSLKDSLAGNEVDLRLGDFFVSTEVFDLTNSVIKLKDISLADTKITVLQNKLPVITADSLETATVEVDSILFDVGFGEMSLNNVEAFYSHQRTGEIAHVNFGEVSVVANSIDLQKQSIGLSKIKLANSDFLYQQMAGDSIVKKQTDESEKRVNNGQTTNGKQQAEKARPWTFSLDALDLANNSIRYDDFFIPEIRGSVDFNHLAVTDLNTRAENIEYKGSEIKAKLNNFSFVEKSGFRIESFRTTVALNEKSLTIKDFDFNSSKSRIVLEIHADFESFEEIAQSYPEAKLRIRVLPSEISLQDIVYFNPTLLDSMPLKLSKSETVKVEAVINGPVNNLRIEHFLISALKNTRLNVSGHIRGMPDMNTAVMNIALHKLYTTRTDMENILADTLIPESIQLPEWINLTADVKGTMRHPDVKSALTTDFGSVDLIANVNLDSAVKENYKAQLMIHEFQMGKLLKQGETMGILDMEASVKGAGLQLDDLDALVELSINTFQYNGYDYQDFKLDGALKRQFFLGNAFMDDKNLSLEFHGGFDYNEEIPQYEFTFELKNADFKALRLTHRPLKARGTLDVNLSTSDFKVLNGYVNIRKFAVYDGDQLYAVDSLLFASLDLEGQNEVSVRSDILTADFKGNINLFMLPDALNQHFNKYFSPIESDTTVSSIAKGEEQNFEFDLVIKNTDLITEILLPELESFVPVEISGEFDSAEDNLSLTINVAEINYGGLLLDSVLFRAKSDQQSLDFTLAFQKVRKDTMRIHEMRLAANVMNDSIRSSFKILDSLEQEKYFLGGVFYSLEDAYQFSFLQGQILLNYEEWETKRYNALRFSPEGLLPNNFFISQGESRILLYKREDQDSTLTLAFNDVAIRNLSSLIEGTTPLDGVLDGDLNISAAKSGSFNTNLWIKDLRILEQPWGDLLIALGQPPGGPLNIKLELEGENAEANVFGYITQDSIPKMDFNASIPRFNLSVAEPLTMGQLKNLKGNLNAQVSVKGTSDDQSVNGRINLQNTSFLSTYVNSEFTLEDETITLESPRIVFDNFKILDNKKNIAAIDGYVSTDTTQGLLLKLNLSAKNFQLLNTTEKDNELFYGNIRINTQAKINGSSVQPHVQMNVSLSEDSEFTYVVPQSEQGVTEQKGIVVFVDRDAEGDPFMETIDPRDTIKTTFAGMDLTANIELTDTETFNIIIDPITGDRLSVKGNSTLSFSMDPSGDMQLTGRYEITEGTYDFSFYKLVKRNFKIEKGSYIVWSGDPLNATMNIRAIYEIETSPIDLMVNQSGEGELNMYKQRLPFLVYLQIRGGLLAPEISFELDMPENQKNAFGGSVYAKIKDVNTRESDLNKQVFALLVLKRFISDNPLESQAGEDMASTARRSVSKLLTEQLNRLSQNVKGVELSFDVRSYEDYTTGDAEGRTELQLGLSKTFLNDRLVVKVSGAVDLEGDASNQSSFSDFIGDLALEYKLTEDGRFRVTGFRNSNYDMIDGELIETGAGLIYIKDYDSLKELFRSNKK